MNLNKLTKADLANTFYDELGKNLGLGRRQARDFVNAFFESLAAAIENDDNVTITNFGRFNCRTRGQKIGRNVHLGSDVLIEEARTVSFSPSQALLNLVREKKEENVSIPNQDRAA